MERNRNPRQPAEPTVLPLPDREKAHHRMRARFLRPEPGRWFLPRPRLHRLLALGAMARLTLVTAPAGYGKTALVSDWVSRHAPRSAWISLDERSNNFPTFVSDLLEAMSGVSTLHTTTVQAMMPEGAFPNPEQLARALADDLAELGDRLVVVLDDFHTVDDPAILVFLDTLLLSNCPYLHVVLCSRHQPLVSINILGAHGQYLEIDGATLAFTREEVADYLTLVLEDTPSNEMVDAWWTNSEGWIALMQLAAINQVIAGSGEPVAAMMSKARASVAAFLSTSLIDQLPADLHTFLLIVSIPHVLCADLAEALTSDRLGTADAQAMLDDIVHRGLFLSRLDQEGTWYRFHPLFREMLQGKLLEVFGQGQVNVMHIATAQWCARNQRIDRAIEHLLVAGDSNGAADLVASHAQMTLLHDRWLELDGWLHQLPASVVEARADLLLARAMVAQVQGLYDEIPHSIERVNELLSRQGDASYPDRDALLAETEVLNLFSIQSGEHVKQDYTARWERIFRNLLGSNRMAELMAVQLYAITVGPYDPAGAQQTIDRYMAMALAGNTEFDTYRRLWTRSAQVILSRHTGSIDRYHDLAASLLSMATSANARRMATMAHFFLGAVAWERNQIERAIDHMRAVVADPVPGTLYYVLSSCLLADGLDLIGDQEGSRLVIKQLRERGVRTGSPLIATRLRQLTADIAIRRGEVPAGISTLQQALLTQTNAAMRIAETYPISLTVPLIHSGLRDNIDRARNILQTVAERDDERHLPGHRIGCDVLLAWIERLDGRDADAHARLSRALQQANDFGRVRSVIGLGPFMLPLLEWHTAGGYGTDYCDFLIESLEYEHGLAPAAHEAAAIFDAAQRPLEPGEMEELTNREIDVLLGLQRRLSNKEIGDELNISHLTVKSHARSIYFKLGVSGRRQAIQRAHELGLLHNRF